MTLIISMHVHGLFKLINEYNLPDYKFVLSKKREGHIKNNTFN